MMDILTELQHEEQRFLYEYWLSKCNGPIVPSRLDIDPLDFYKLLPHIFIYNVTQDPLDYNVRLFGTGLSEIAGRDYTGKSFDQVHSKAENADAIRENYNEVALTLKPHVRTARASWINKDYINYTRLLLPLSENGETANMLLGLALLKPLRTG